MIWWHCCVRDNEPIQKRIRKKMTNEMCRAFLLFALSLQFFKVSTSSSWFRLGEGISSRKAKMLHFLTLLLTRKVWAVTNFNLQLVNEKAISRILMERRFQDCWWMSHALVMRLVSNRSDWVEIQQLVHTTARTSWLTHWKYITINAQPTSWYCQHLLSASQC